MAVLERWIAAMEALNHDAAHGVALLGPLYHPELRFTGPLQTTRGREEFLAMMRRMTSSARELKFTALDGTETPTTLYFAWRLALRTRGLGAPLRVEGLTRCVLAEELILEQRDYWDLLGSAADAVPMAGMVLRRLVASFSM